MTESSASKPTVPSLDAAADVAGVKPHLARDTNSKVTWILSTLAGLALAASATLWLKLSGIQESLARQSLEATAASQEAKALAKASQEAVKELIAKQMLLESQVKEVAVQRAQLDELMQSLSRSRDENLVVDLDSAIRLAQQQSNLTGSLEPLLAALRSAEQRVNRTRLPRLSQLQRALAKDIERVKSANVADTPTLLIKLDELVRLADEIPVANAVASGSKPVNASSPTRKIAEESAPASGMLTAAPQWIRTMASAVRVELRALVRVSRVDVPEAALLVPEQAFFVRENFKLKILNARLALLSRQFDSVRTDLNAATRLNARYFDPASRQSVQAAGLIAQVQGQIKSAEQPRIDDTLAALASLAAASAQSR